MSRTGFETLLLKVAEAIPASNTGRPPIDLQKSLLVFCQYLGTEETMASIGQRFGITVSLTNKTIHALLNIITPHISSRYISWPSHAQFLVIGDGFREKSPNMPAVIAGAIDGCEVPIMTPKEDPASYFNRKQFHSIKLQGIVDHTSKFIDVFIGWPGRSHDSRAFVNSPIYNALENNNNQLLPQNFFIVGDSAYPLKKYLITPFKHQAATQQQRRFNKALSKARIQVECAFGQLTCRWRRLRYIYMHDIKEISKLILAACTLHNFCKSENELVFEDDALPLLHMVDDVNDNPIFAADMNASHRRNELLQMF